MRERPILFSAPMIQAILAGTKSQTRRIVKPQPPTVEAVRAKSGSDYGWFTDKQSPVAFRVSGPVWAVRDLGCPVEIRCPYGRVGDRLWVRETWRHALAEHHCYAYRADESYTCGRDVPHEVQPSEKWRPSIYMPRRASRITLEVTDVRVECLQDISEEDARAEGVSEPDAARRAFALLWDAINYERAPWSSNPWCWVVGFRRIETRTEAACRRT